MSFHTSYVYLEPRPLPSIGITRLRQYYGPLRHPKAPDLSLTGVRLIILATHAKGLPVLRCFPCVHAVTTTPAQQREMYFAQFPRCISLPRNGDRVGLCIVLFEDCPVFTLHYGLHTRWITYSDPLHRRLQLFRYLHFCYYCFRPERSSRVGFTPTGKAPPFHGARQGRSLP